MWLAHAAITTPDGHFHAQRYARGGIGQAGVRLDGDGGGFNAWLDDWEWRSARADMFPASSVSTSVSARSSSCWKALASWSTNGVDGYSQKSAQGQASYYYSQPHFRVRGFVNQGLEKNYLSGQGWLDREWSSQALAQTSRAGTGFPCISTMATS